MGVDQASQEQFDQLCAAIEKSNADLLQAMPDEAATLHLMYVAHERLKAWDWRDIRSCPKDGTPFEVIEPGSSGIHYCTFNTFAKNGTTPFWISEAGDLWPARPIFWRPLPAESGLGDREAAVPRDAMSAPAEPHPLDMDAHSQMGEGS